MPHQQGSSCALLRPFRSLTSHPDLRGLRRPSPGLAAEPGRKLWVEGTDPDAALHNHHPAPATPTQHAPVLRACPPCPPFCASRRGQGVRSCPSRFPQRQRRRPLHHHRHRHRHRPGPLHPLRWVLRWGCGGAARSSWCPALGWPRLPRRCGGGGGGGGGGVGPGCPTVGGRVGPLWAVPRRFRLQQAEGDEGSEGSSRERQQAVQRQENTGGGGACNAPCTPGMGSRLPWEPPSTSLMPSCTSCSKSACVWLCREGRPSGRGLKLAVSVPAPAALFKGVRQPQRHARGGTAGVRSRAGASGRPAGPSPEGRCARRTARSWPGSVAMRLQRLRLRRESGQAAPASSRARAR